MVTVSAPSSGEAVHVHRIWHYIEIEASPDVVFDAVATAEGVSHWWGEARDEPSEVAPDAAGRVMYIGSGPDGGWFRAEVTEAERPTSVRWRFLEDSDGDSEQSRKGTEVEFHADEMATGTGLRFVHGPWERRDDLFGERNYFWGFFMRNLKRYAERGSGQSAPRHFVERPEDRES